MGLCSDPATPIGRPKQTLNSSGRLVHCRLRPVLSWVVRGLGCHAEVVNWVLGVKLYTSCLPSWADSAGVKVRLRTLPAVKLLSHLWASGLLHSVASANLCGGRSDDPRQAITNQ